MRLRVPDAVPDRSGYPRSQVMAQIRSTDTGPERRLRSELHRLGVRFRLGQVVPVDAGRPLRPDLVIRKYRLAVFVDGCFWHGCPAHFRPPASNESYWRPKIARTRERDRRADSLLADKGWTVIRAWEHDDMAEVAGRIRDLLVRQLFY